MIKNCCKEEFILHVNKKKIPNFACIPKLTKFHSSISSHSMTNLPKIVTSRTTIHYFLFKANKHLNADKIAIFLTLNNNIFLTFHSNYYPIPLPNSPTSSSSHLLYQPSTKSLSTFPSPEPEDPIGDGSNVAPSQSSRIFPEAGGLRKVQD